MAPRRAYLELDAHPAIKVPYTFIAETARKKSAVKEIKKMGEDEG